MRQDPWLNTLVHIVESRQSRPNLPSDQCPFCVGGLEAPQPYNIKSFKNRWPAMADDRCEVVLYTSEHNSSIAELSVNQVKEIVDLWTLRASSLMSRHDVQSVLIFENRGREVGATIDHPHCQIYAFDHVPQRTLQRLSSKWHPDSDLERRIIEINGWAAWVISAPIYPISIEIAPLTRVANLSSLTEAERINFAVILKNVLQTEYNLNSLLADLCVALERRYLQLRAQKFADLHRDYLQHLFKFGEQCKFRVDDQVIEAEISGVSPAGLLELKTSKGTQTFGFKEIAFCFD